MKAYKFRTVENLHFVIDIVFNRRLYCCRSDHLNDIREADVRVGNDEGRVHEIIEFGDQVTRRLRELRVCSFSRSFNNHLLWAHYAGGYTGIAIEVDLEDDEVTEVLYDDNFIFLSELIEEGSPEDAARQVLTRKYKAWSYEEEVRLITKAEFHPLTRPISRIIVGSRANPALVSALYLVCSHFGITLDRMVVADWGHLHRRCAAITPLSREMKTNRITAQEQCMHTCPPGYRALARFPGRASSQTDFIPSSRRAARTWLRTRSAALRARRASSSVTTMSSPG